MVVSGKLTYCWALLRVISDKARFGVWGNWLCRLVVFALKLDKTAYLA